MADRPNAAPGDVRGYVLGIDLGTTYSAAAIARGTKVEPCVLGTIASQIPSVVVHRDDNEILIGEAAERRAASEPTRTAREFKRRLGDPIPIIVGGTPYGAEALMAELLEAIVRQVTEREGQSPTTIVLTHPANYTEYKRGLLLEAARLAGLDLDRVHLITEPEAAAIAYAHQQRIDPGEIIAVYDFGGGTFDAAVVRDTPDGFELIGTPEGLERLGGIDFDQAVLSHVDTTLDGLVSSADASDPQVIAGQARLRTECRLAKEALSTDTDANIAVAIPGVQMDVRLTRDELEQMVRPRVTETVKALERTIASAGIGPADVSRVLLVGGSSRMPIVAHVIREAVGRPVSMDTDPKLAIAIGAALSMAPPATVTAPVAPAPTAVDPGVAPPPPEREGRPRWLLVVGVALVFGLVAAAAVVLLTRDGGDSATAPETSVAAEVTVAVAEPQTTEPDIVTSAESDVSTPGAPERLAFNGEIGSAGIPGPAVDANAPGELVGLAVGADDVVQVLSVSPAVIGVRDGEVAVTAQLDGDDLPAGGITVGSDGTVFVATNAGIARIDGGTRELFVDGAGAGLSSELGPLTLDGGGNLYVADNGGARVIRVAPDGSLTLVAGTGTPAGPDSTITEGDAAATTAIGQIVGLAVNRDGTLLLADATRNIVASVSTDGTITTRSADVTAGSLSALAVDLQGAIYVSDDERGTITRINTDNSPEVVAGGPGAPITGVNALAISPMGALIYSDGSAVWNIAGVAAAT